MKTASMVIAIAEKEVGYLEKASNKELDSRTGNAGSANYTKYADYIDKNCPSFYNGKKNGYAWCDVFVDWCFIKAFGEAAAKELLCQPEKSAGAGCEFSAGYYKAKKRLYKTPKVGDQIFFIGSSGIYHTGIVYKVDSKYVYTIEGNTSGASGVIPNGGGVCKKSYAKGSSFIYGYGRPKYDSDSDSTSNNKKSVEELAKEVMAGKWSTGLERKEKLTVAGYDYDKVQDRVNELMNTHIEQKSYNVQVIAKSGLNVRKGAGITYSRVTALTYGTKVTVTEEKNGWGKISSGWICLEYTKRL